MRRCVEGPEARENGWLRSRSPHYCLLTALFPTRFPLGSKPQVKEAGSVREGACG